MKDLHLLSWFLSYDLSKISPRLVITLNHNIIFARFLKMLLDNSVASSHNTFVDTAIIIRILFEFTFSDFFIKGSISRKYFFKMHLKNTTHLGFGWLMKSIETIKLYNRSFCCCYSLRFYISMLRPYGSRHPEIASYC